MPIDSLETVPRRRAGHPAGNSRRDGSMLSPRLTAGDLLQDGLMPGPGTRSRIPFERLRRFLPALAAALFLVLTGTLRAEHSDIIVARSNGVLRVDSTIHESDVRENDVYGNGTVWATDNPGFAGSGFVFDDELLFDITGPLKRWNGTNWSTANVLAEEMEFVEPGPFGESINSVTIRKNTSFASGYRITQIGTRGTLHTHFVFILRATNGVAPTVGAYTFPLTLRSPQYASAPPVHLVFNNGLAEADFTAAVDRFQAAQQMRLTLAPPALGTVSLSWSTTEGKTNHLESAPTPSGPWTTLGEPVVGDGGLRQTNLVHGVDNRFFRLRTP